MPSSEVQRLREERKRLGKDPPRAGRDPHGTANSEDKILFAAADHFLDQAVDGPLHLKNPSAAKIVEDAILFGAETRYELLAWCVMANHVHVLLLPLWELWQITKGIKGFTARQVKTLEQKEGRVFWQDESYDHWARDEAELLRIIHYIENNPVAAMLCRKPEEWPWSSARFRNGWPPGEPFRATQHRESG